MNNFIKKMKNLFIKKKEEKGINVVSLFDGMSCALIALKDMGVKVNLYIASELDKNAMAVSKHNNPEIIQIGDVKSLDYDKILEMCGGKIDLLIGGSPCFPEGTSIMTKCGYKNIETIKQGDFVLTHKNRFNKVSKTMVKESDKIFEINAFGLIDLKATPEHPFYVRQKSKKWNNSKRSYDRTFGDAHWVNANDLEKGHYIGYAINKESKTPEWNGVTCIKNQFINETKNDLKEQFNNPYFWFFIGRYLADGWITKYKKKGRNNSNNYKVTICCNKNEIKDLENIFNKIDFKYTKVEERTVFKLSISSIELYEFLSQFKKGAKNKTINSTILNLPTNLLQKFIEGYFSGDGFFEKTTSLYRATTISKELALGIQACVMKVFKVPCRLYYNETKKIKEIEGRIVNQSNTYEIRFKKDIKKSDKAFYEDGYVWAPFYGKKIINRNELVYNFEVEEDNSYTANNVIVHNCQDLSIAKSNRQGLNGERSGLFWNYVEAKERLNPKYFVLENVASMSSQNKQIISDALGVDAININSEKLSAQKRNRLYWTNIKVEQPKDLEIKLKNVLENGYTDKEKSYCLDANYFKGSNYEIYVKKSKRQIVFENKKVSPKSIKENESVFMKDFVEGNVKMHEACGEKKTDKEKSLLFNDRGFRKLTVLECERLQCVPDNYTNVHGVSDTERYRMIGNGFTISVIKHILSGAFN
jgi:site-specific DNA-cytosine methylase/intein/homing endonuclease